MKFDMKFDKPTLVTITAPTCSGKSYLLDLMTKADPFVEATMFKTLFSRIVSTTTRPKRTGEVDGFDYHFISADESKRMEAVCQFAELIEFRGARYGVTKAEMDGKMSGELAPIIVLEPQGLKIYEQMCWDNGWEIFKIYVTVEESVRLKRLNARTAIDIRDAVFDAYQNALGAGVMHHIPALEATEKHIKVHTDRVLSITGDERRWRASNSWDLIIPGDDHKKAIQDIEQGIKWRNHRNAQLNTSTLGSAIVHAIFSL